MSKSTKPKPKQPKIVKPKQSPQRPPKVVPAAERAKNDARDERRLSRAADKASGPGMSTSATRRADWSASRRERAMLKIDPKRTDMPESGIYIRAKDASGKWVSADITHLDKESVKEWLAAHNRDSRYAEDVVGILLGHGHLHVTGDPPGKPSRG